MPLLKAEGLIKDYHDEGVATHVLKGISFSIEAGEFVSIMGASGSGKSTLMHILGLLDRPTSGSYIFDGRSTSDLSDEELAATRNERIGFVFQSFHLLPRISVLANVMVPLEYSTVPKNEWRPRAMAALERVGLGHRLNYRPTQLSGGERQRTAIARALIIDPKLILADEPTGNLDSKNGEAVLKLIADLNRAGHTIVLVTHELAAAKVGRRILTIQDGMLLKDEAVQPAQAPVL